MDGASTAPSLERCRRRSITTSISPPTYSNFDLRNCYVDNLDLRYEWYPSRGEVISLAAFWKHFDSPIEWVYTLSGGTDVIYSYMNARSANNYGLELDIRKQLDFIGLKDFSWSFNGALIHSRVRFCPG